MVQTPRSKQPAEITLIYKRTEDLDLDNLFAETFHQFFAEAEAEFRASSLTNAINQNDHEK